MPGHAPQPAPSSSRQPDAPYVDCPIRVRYAETDRMGVAYYANHFVWFEVGRSEYCRRRGFSYEAMERETGTLLMVIEAGCRYRGAVTYDDQILVRTWVGGLNRRSLHFHYQLLRQDNARLIAEGETRHLVVDRGGKPRSMPEQYFQMLKA